MAARWEWIDSWEALLELAPEWQRLWEQCDAAPFQSPAWLLPWWRHYGEGRLACVTVREQGRLRAFAPAYVYDGGDSPQLFLLGASSSDYLDVLVAPDAGDGRELLAAFFASDVGWLHADFRQLPPGSLLLRAPQHELLADEVCPVLELPASVAQLDARIPAGFRHRLRYARRRAEAMGEVRFERVRGSGVASAVKAILQLHAARWTNHGENWPDQQRAYGFLRDAAPSMEAAGLLRVYTLAIGGAIAAGYCGFFHRGRAYYYLSGFDARRAAASPGNLIVEHAIRASIDEGAREFDFLRGSEPYKYAWGATDRLTYRRIFNRLAAAPVAAA